MKQIIKSLIRPSFLNFAGLQAFYKLQRFWPDSASDVHAKTVTKWKQV